MGKTVLVVGATGLIGNAVMKELAANEPDTEVIAISRREPENTFGAKFISVDLRDENNCLQKLANLSGLTHVVYAGLYEKEDLTAGWVDEEQIEINRLMIHNLFQSILSKNTNSIEHITLLQGTKAYGGHVRRFSIPAKEGRDDARDIPNFYWEHEAYIKDLQKNHSFAYTILRPQIVIGKAVGSAMNLIPAIGVYASLLREAGQPLHFPGTVSALIEAVDVDLLARAIIWAGEEEVAQNETFNIANGDVVYFEDIWKTIAEAFDMPLGENQPFMLSETLPQKEEAWRKIAGKYGLKTVDLNKFVGQAFQFADRYLNKLNYPLIVSTIKIRQAGFTEVMDSEEMFRKWIKAFQDSRLLPY